MADPLPRNSNEPQYLEHFGMPSAPFARLTSTKNLYLTEQYSFLLAHLANATEKADSLILVCGENGSGKTSLLNRFISSIDENICFASINEFCNTEIDFFLSVLRQFGFGDISGTLEELRYITHEFLIQQGKAGDPVLLVIDNAHLLSPNVFEQLRWMVSVKYEDVTVTNIILAGNPELARIMESPAMSQISARNHVRFNIRAYTEEETASYIWHRLDLVGCRQMVQFSSDVHPLIYRFTGGIPRLINILCDAVLQEALEANSKTISGEMLRRAAKRHELVPHAVPLQSKSRRRTDPGFQDPGDSSVTELVDSRKPSASQKAAATDAVTKPDDSGSGSDVSQNARTIATPSEPDPKLLKKLAAVTEQAEKLKADAVEASASLDRQSALILDLEGKLEDKTLSIDVLTADLETSKKETHSLRTKIDGLTRKLARQDKATAKLVSDLADRRDVIARLESELGDANERLITLDGLEEASRTSQQQLLDRQTEATALRSELSILRRKEADLSEQLDIATSRLAELDALRKAVSDLEDEASSRSKELAAFRRQNSEQEKKADELEAQLRSSEASRKDLEEQVQRIPQLENDLGNRDDRIEDIQSALIERDEELRQLHGQLDEQVAKSGELEAQLSESKNIAADLEQQAAKNQELSELVAIRDKELSAQAEKFDEFEAEQLAAAAMVAADLEQQATENHELSELIAVKDKELGEQIARFSEFEAQQLSAAAKVAADLEQQVTENEELSKLIAIKEQELSALQSALDDNSDYSELHKAELARIGKLETQLQDAQQAAEDLKGDLRSRDESIDGLQAEISEAREENSWLKSEIRRLREVDGKLADQVQHSEDLATNLADRDSQLSQLADAQSELEKMLEEARNEATSQEEASASRISDLQEKLDRGNEEAESLSAQIAKQNDEIESLRSDVARLHETEGTLADQNKLAAQLQSQLDASNKEQEELAARLAEQTTLLDAGGKEQEALAATLAEQAALLEAGGKEREELVTRLAEQTNQLDEGGKEQEDLANRLAEQSALLEASNKEQEELVARLAEQTTMLDAGREKQEELASTLSEHMTLLDAANQKIAQMMKIEAELASTTERLGDLESELADKGGVVETLQAEVDEKRNLIVTLQAEIDSLSASEEELKQRSASATDKDKRLEELQDEIARLTGEIQDRDELREEIGKNAGRVSEFEQQIAIKTEEFSVLAEKHARLEEALNEAQKSLAAQAVELSDSHTASIDVSDLQDRLAEQLMINAELSGELELQSTRARVLEAKIQALGAAEKNLAKNTSRVSETPRPDADAIDVSDGSVLITIIFDGKVEQEIVREIAGLRCMIGRSEDSDMRLNVDTVSRHHAILACKDDNLYIEDLNSTNGIELNFRRITVGRLQFGDVVSVGDYELRFSRSELG